MELTVLSAQEHPQIAAAAIARDRLNHATWGAPLSIEEWIDREALLWRHPFAQHGLRLWLLHRDGGVVASSESYAVPVVHAGARGIAHGMASVFVEERLRGQGLASALLMAVHDRLRAEGALCTYLMSEVGPKIYERLGYVARPMHVRRASALTPGKADVPGVEWIDRAALPLLLGATPVDAGSSAGVRLLATADQLDWHVERGSYYARHMGRAQQQIVGARMGQSWAVWAADPAADLLRVLALQIGEDGGADALWHSARVAAGQLALSAVEAWEEGEQTGGRSTGARLPCPDLPMMCALQPGIDPATWIGCARGLWI